MTRAGDLLRRVPFLAALTVTDRRALVAAANRRRFGRGEAIFHKDERGELLFIIEEGSVRIYLPSPQGADLTLAVLGAGDFFGDMALLDGGPRSASAMALRETATLVLGRADFTAVLQSRPKSAMAVLAAVAQRLREADEMAGGPGVPGRGRACGEEAAGAGGRSRCAAAGGDAAGVAPDPGGAGEYGGGDAGEREPAPVDAATAGRHHP